MSVNIPNLEMQTCKNVWHLMNAFTLFLKLSAEILIRMKIFSREQMKISQLKTALCIYQNFILNLCVTSITLHFTGTTA